MSDRDSWFRADAGVWGERIALGTAVALTAKSEYDLAVLAHFAKGIAWLYPVMLDVYVVTAFHKRRKVDMFVALALMLFSQVAVHLVPVFITTGEQVPWGLVMAVACVAPIVVVRVKMLTGRTAAEREAEEAAARQAEEVTRLRAQLADANRKAADEGAGRRAEETARQQAEERADAERTGREVAEAEAVREAEERADDNRKSAAEIARLHAQAREVKASARDARTQAAEASEEAARIAGQLDEARAAADRAAAGRAAAEQHAAALTEARQAIADELARVQQAHARLARKAAEDGDRKTARKNGRKTVGSSGSGTRKELPAVAPTLPPVAPEELPAVPGVSVELTARVVAALQVEPDATQGRLAELARTTDRTVRTVLKHLPVDAEEITDDRAAV
ncbi:hypothetical protein TPA0907_56100 [Micromonospora humidisoli]|uniref:hypothetical protein n=1 Tax=Micromonospora sp. AKA109 TaxID=2733865 RepID=UPI0022CB2231|nr:hypothetical protein [Micromonospora sp. AKA109]GHJ11243.1 hypothetical protein TPA0907_56100 [Micromonospora sp. AKA109]